MHLFVLSQILILLCPVILYIVIQSPILCFAHGMNVIYSTEHVVVKWHKANCVNLMYEISITLATVMQNKICK